MTMKFRVEWLLVSILITAAAWSGVAGAVSPAAEKTILKWCQYKIDAPTNITVYASEDARRIVDEVFLPACKGDDASKRQPLVRMKRLFAEGLAGVFSCEGIHDSEPITAYVVFRRDLDFSFEYRSGDDGACKAWRLSRYCQGWRVDVLKKTGECARYGFRLSFLTLDEVPPFFCEHERFLIPFADSLAETLYRERNALFLQRHYNPAYPIASILEDLTA